MSCQETQQLLSLYVDDQLALPVRAACDEHLRACPVCRAELAEMRAISRGLATLARPLPPPDMASAISDRLLIEAAARERQPVLPFGVRLNRWLRPRACLIPERSISARLITFFACRALIWRVAPGDRSEWRVPPPIRTCRCSTTASSR